VKYAPTGAARGTVDRVLSSLGVAGKINDVSGAPQTVELAPGEYEIDFFPVSEILQNKKLENLGLVPAPLQVPAEIEAVIARGTYNPAAKAFVKFLQGPIIEPALKSSGMVKAH
jgi:ABC-type molybdate transport system substrate-binding protein